ncbi:MAG: LptF/LptG family permease [Rikenellaceae bacterium]
MKTLNKFILKSYLGPMVMTFFIVTFILMLNFLWRYIDELVGRGLPFSAILELIFYATSTLIPMGLPLATLLAAIMTMGNLGENNELLALKAAGISLQRIIRPIVGVAAVIACVSFFVINNYVPYSFEKMNSLLFDIRQQRQQIEFKDGVFFDGIPNIAIRVENQNSETKLLKNIMIYDNRESSKPNTIVADSGYINLNEDKTFLQLKLYDGQTYEGNRSYSWYDNPTLRHHVFSYQQILIELDGFNFERSENDMFGDRSGSKNLSELFIDADSLEIVTKDKLSGFSYHVLKNYLFSKDTIVIANNDSINALKVFEVDRQTIAFDTLSIERKSEILKMASTSLTNMRYYINGEHDNIRSSTMKLYDTYISMHEKLSLPVSIIIFFLIGAPLGAIIRKGGLGLPIVISVLFFVFYYIITMIGKKLVSDGAWVPFAGMWLSSFILAPLAIFLTYKSTTDSPLMDADTYTNKIKKVVAVALVIASPIINVYKSIFKKIKTEK